MQQPVHCENKILFGRRLLDAFVVATFFSLTIFFFAPLHIYLTNRLAFNFSSYATILLLLLIISAISITLVVLPLIVLRGGIYKKSIILLFIISILMWLEGNILVFRHGTFKGVDIEWNKYWIRAVVDSVIWISLIIIALKQSSFIYKFFHKISAGVLFVQFLAAILIMCQVVIFPYPEKYGYEKNTVYDFSSRKNIIILTLDSFQSDIFQEIIDEETSYKKYFEGFTYFRNALSGSPLTYLSVPMILTGRYYDNSIPIREFIKNALLTSSLPKTLKDNGFKVELYPFYYSLWLCDENIASNLKKLHPSRILKLDGETALLYDVALFRYLPFIIKKYIINNDEFLLQSMLKEQGKKKSAIKRLPKKQKIKKASIQIPFKVQERKKSAIFLKDSPKRFLPGMKSSVCEEISFFKEMERSAIRISGERPIFKYIHLQGLHPPLRFNEHLESEKLALNRQNYKKQAKGLLILLEVFLKKLKKIGAYENTFICIIGDHGIRNQAVGVKISEELLKTGALSPEWLDQKGQPLILIKRFAGRGKLKISDAPVCLSDIPKTIVTEIGLKEDFPGLDMFKIKPFEQRERIYLDTYKAAGHIEDGFFAPMKVYVISGFSWYAKSWQKTDILLKPSRKNAFAEFCRMFMRYVN